jgi:hypothetical protein
LVEVSFEVQYNQVTRNLVFNAATNPANFGVSPDTSGWVGRLTLTKGW